MFQISHSNIRSEWKQNHIVVVEFQKTGEKIRAMVQGIPKQSNSVETIYGEVNPEIAPMKLFSFYTLVDAQKFINAL